MTYGEFDEWKRELLFNGIIVQDADESVPWPDREDRFNRYVKLVEGVKGTEGLEGAVAIIQSFQSPQDYGAYQAAFHALGRFPRETYLAALIHELPSLIQRQPDWAGDLLCGLANSVGTRFERDIAEFRQLLAAAQPSVQSSIRAYITAEEATGWLEHRKGILS